MTSINTTSYRVPLDEDYASCSECYAVLLIYTDSEDPVELATSLRLDWDKIITKGTGFKNSLGRERIAPLSYLSYSTEKKVQSKDIRHHLSFLVADLIPFKKLLQAWQRRQGVKMGVNCIWVPKESSFGGGGPALWPEQMRWLIELNLELSFSIYFNDKLENRH